MWLFIMPFSMIEGIKEQHEYGPCTLNSERRNIMIQLFKKWIAMVIQLFRHKQVPSTLTTEKEEKVPKALSLDLQFFAGDDDDPDDDQDDDPDDDQDDDGPDLDELLKDPNFKKQYQAKFKEQLGKRMKRFADVDPDEYRRLKEQADKKQQKKDEDEDDEKTQLQQKLNEQEKKLVAAERKEKRIAVKEYAIDNGYNPKLVARLMDVDSLEMDEDGEILDLEDKMDELIEEFPELFSSDDDEDDEEEKTKKKKSSRYIAGSRQKGNKQRKVDRRAAGAERAKQRHKKEDEN